MTRNKKKAYKQMAKGRAKEVRGILKFLRGLFIVKKADVRFGVEKWRADRRNRALQHTLRGRAAEAARRLGSRFVYGIKVTAYSIYAVLRGITTRFR